MIVKHLGPHVLDKEPGSRVWTLGLEDVTLHAEFRVHAPVLELEGDDQEIADWLTHRRNQHLDLSRSTGHYLRYLYYEIPDRPPAVKAVVWWEDEIEWLARLRQYGQEGAAHASREWSGPLLDLGITFLMWRQSVRDAKLVQQAELMAVMQESVAQEVDALVLGL